MSAGRYTALVLAASRRGAEDPVAKVQNLSHKCLVTLNGIAMVERVIATLRATPEIDRVFVSIESPDILRRVPRLAAMLDAGEITALASEGNLAHSIAKAANEIPDAHPLIVTTADNALHTPEILSHFCGQVAASDADVLVAMTRAETILAKYPGGQRAFHRLRDGAYSSCNLYCIRTPNGAGAARAFATGGQFGKKPERIINAFGLWAFILYKLRVVGIDGVMRQISRALGPSVKVSILPWAEAPIDVDNAKDYALVTEILRRQEGMRA
jgi:GTP:adenosylcobinamide-phosphate guanylyltransferase